MPITTLDGYIASQKQIFPYIKTIGLGTTPAHAYFSLFGLAGQPGLGIMNVGNTANGLVHTSATAGYPLINAFATGADGYLSRAMCTWNTTGRLFLYDRLFVAGAYAFNADVTLVNQPSYASRVPNGVNFNGLEIWVEQDTSATGNQAVQVDYVNQAGVAGRTTGAVGIGAAPVGLRCWRLFLQSGDSGVQRIDRVRGTVATAGTFNVMVLRPLWTGHIPVVGVNVLHDMLSTGLPQVWSTSALYVIVSPAGATTGTPMLQLEVASG